MEEKKVDTKSMVSDIFPIEEWRKGFDIMGRGEGMKVLPEPDPL